jgi:hypothetical protein
MRRVLIKLPEGELNTVDALKWLFAHKTGQIHKMTGIPYPTIARARMQWNANDLSEVVAYRLLETLFNHQTQTLWKAK